MTLTPSGRNASANTKRSSFAIDSLSPQIMVELNYGESSKCSNQRYTYLHTMITVTRASVTKNKSFNWQNRNLFSREIQWPLILFGFRLSYDVPCVERRESLPLNVRLLQLRLVSLEAVRLIIARRLKTVFLRFFFNPKSMEIALSSKFWIQIVSLIISAINEHSHCWQVWLGACTICCLTMIV